MINRISRYSVDVSGISVPYEIHHVETHNSHSVMPFPYQLDGSPVSYHKTSYELRLKELSADQLNAIINAIDGRANGEKANKEESKDSEENS